MSDSMDDAEPNALPVYRSARPECPALQMQVFLPKAGRVGC